jgi:hypothetical protein
MKRWGGASARIVRRGERDRAVLRFVAALALVSSRTIGDIALMGAGVAAAGASVVFAGVMVVQADGGSRVNGIEYLAIFSRPNGIASPPAVAEPSPPEIGQRAGSSEIDVAPTGSIRQAPRSVSAPDDGFHIIRGQQDLVWMRRGGIIRAVRPGDVVPGLGRVGSIEQRRGGWALLDASGAILLASDATGKSGQRTNRLSDGLIFN